MRLARLPNRAVPQPHDADDNRKQVGAVADYF
jgi:hypothetical protein